MLNGKDPFVMSETYLTVLSSFSISKIIYTYRRKNIPTVTKSYTSYNALCHSSTAFLAWIMLGWLTHLPPPVKTNFITRHKAFSATTCPLSPQNRSSEVWPHQLPWYVLIMCYTLYNSFICRLACHQLGRVSTAPVNVLTSSASLLNFTDTWQGSHTARKWLTASWISPWSLVTAARKLYGRQDMHWVETYNLKRSIVLTDSNHIEMY